jgi:CDP-diacylglycerol---glycerol-3-phosphate 3-phosphatidyltransferase
MDKQTGLYQPALTQLEKSWRTYTLASGLFLLAGFLLLSFQWASPGWAPGYGLVWLVLPVVALAYQSQVLRRHLGDNHRSGETELLPELGWGNRLTLLRSVLVAGMMGFLLLPRPQGWLYWLPGILYTVSDIADFFDGYVARRTNHATKLGEILDMSFDGVGVLAACILAVQYGQVPGWYLLIGAARYLFVLGMALRTRLGRPNYPLPPSRSRRVFAGLQMGFLAGILLPIFTPPGTWIAATLFGAPVLFGFIRDWLSVSGVLKARAAKGTSRLALLESWLPVLLRVSIPVLAFGLGAFYLSDEQALAADWLAGFVLIIHLVLLSLIFIGVLPRILAIGGLCVFGFYQVFGALTTPQIGLAIVYTLILYLGSGPLSLYSPEEILFHRPAGGAEAAPSHLNREARA